MLKVLIPVKNVPMVYSHYLKKYVPDDYSVRQVWNYDIDNDDLVYPDMAVYSSYEFRWLIKEQVIYSSFLKSYIYKKIAVYSKQLDSYIPKNNRRFTQLNGDYLYIPMTKYKTLIDIKHIRGISSDFWQVYRGLALKKATCPPITLY